jgi:hypothetical protein
MPRLIKFLREIVGEDELIQNICHTVVEKYPQLKGHCEDITSDLYHELTSHGIECVHVSGMFRLDEPNAHDYGTTDGDEYEVEHDWI